MTFLLVIYILFLIVFTVFSWAGLYHLWRFGYVGDKTKPVMVLYIIVSISVIVLTLSSLVIRINIGE